MSNLTITHTIDSDVVVRRGDVELLRYIYRPDTAPLESPKPYLHPIRTLGGLEVSLFRPHDHVWHKGIAWSLPHVGDENFWGGPTYVHGQFYVQLPNNGRQNHEEMTRVATTESGVGWEHRLAWISEAGEAMISERRALSVDVVSDDAWVLVFETTMTNETERTISIGSPTTKGRENAGYGGLFWRGPRSFTGGRIITEDGAGGEEVRGQRYEWMAFSGEHDDSTATSTVLMLDDASNPQHPPQWFARNEEFACLCPAPFFSEEVDVLAGESIAFRYAVAIADGGDASLAPRLAELARKTLHHHVAAVGVPTA